MAAAERGADVPSPYGDGIDARRACRPGTSARSSPIHALIRGPATTSWANVPSTSGRSVELRTTITGRFTMLASSCTPPESETSSADSAASPRNSR